jgi:hypothetical protein
MTDRESRFSSRRWLVLANIAAIPYVWLRFPREAGSYTRNCFVCLLTGRRF